MSAWQGSDGVQDTISCRTTQGGVVYRICLDSIFSLDKSGARTLTGASQTFTFSAEVVDAGGCGFQLLLSRN